MKILEQQNIKVSKLYEKGKYYDMRNKDSNGDYIEISESIGGCLAPGSTHCWVTWIDVVESTDGTITPLKQAESFKTLEEANEFAKAPHK